MAGVYANQTKWEVDFSRLLAGTPTYVKIGDVISIDFGGLTSDTLDSSVHGDAWRSYVAGLKDGGTVSMTVRFGPKTHADLLDNVGTKCANQWTFPLETSTNVTPLGIEWDGIIQTVGVAAPHDGLLEASVTVQLSGAPTITDEAAA